MVLMGLKLMRLNRQQMLVDECLPFIKPIWSEPPQISLFIFSSNCHITTNLYFQGALSTDANQNAYNQSEQRNVTYTL